MYGINNINGNVSVYQWRRNGQWRPLINGENQWRNGNKLAKI